MKRMRFFSIEVYSCYSKRFGFSGFAARKDSVILHIPE